MEAFPPPQLVETWVNEINDADGPDRVLGCIHLGYEYEIACKAARWGADMELESCCKLLELSDPNAREFLYAARRPKPPSLKEQSIALIDKIQDSKEAWDISDLNVVRRALESLPE